MTIVDRDETLSLVGLSKLTRFNEKSFTELPKPLQLNFLLRPLRVTTLNDKSDLKVRYDLFERLNTGGIELHPQEIRNCVLRCKFRDDLKDLAQDTVFLDVARLPDGEQKSAEYEECVLRFFAYLENYDQFDHSVKEFLTDYMLEKSRKSVDQAALALFHKTMRWLRDELPNGVVRGNRSKTPINLFEAVTVGTALALKRKATLNRGTLVPLMNSDDLKRLTTGATNSRKRVTGRIEMVRDALLA